MTTRPADVSVTLPVSQALDSVQRVLFRPFDLGKWFVIGFSAWLAHLGEQGFGGNFNFGSGRGHGGSARREIERAWEFVVQNLHWIVPLAISLFALGVVLWLVFTWLNSRGKFMFLHCVALNKADVKEPWNKFACEGNSLFLFRIVLGLIETVVTLPFVAAIAVLVIRMIQHGEPNVGGIIAAVGIFFVLIGVWIVFALIRKLTTDFVVPMMSLRGGSCLKSWREFWDLLTANAGRFVVYVLFQIVLSIVIAALTLIVILATCCVAGCLLAIPYLGTVLLLPVLIFSRSYSLHYLAQYGRDYDGFPPTSSEL